MHFPALLPLCSLKLCASSVKYCAPVSSPSDSAGFCVHHIYSKCSVSLVILRERAGRLVPSGRGVRCNPMRLGEKKSGLSLLISEQSTLRGVAGPLCTSPSVTCPKTPGATIHFSAPFVFRKEAAYFCSRAAVFARRGPPRDRRTNAFRSRAHSSTLLRVKWDVICGGEHYRISALRKSGQKTKCVISRNSPDRAAVSGRCRRRLGCLARSSEADLWKPSVCHPRINAAVGRLSWMPLRKSQWLSYQVFQPKYHREQ